MTRRQEWKLSGLILLIVAILLAVVNRDSVYWIRYEQLRQAAGNGDTTKVRILLALGADPDGWKDYQIDSPGEFTPPIEAAARGDHGKVIRLLTAAGATTETSDCDGVTPLGRAIGLGNTEAVDALRAAGAEALRLR